MTITQFFVDDHKEVESFIQGFRKSLDDAAPDKTAFNRMSNGLHRHIFWEEEILFPLVKEKDVVDRVEGLCTDHAQIWNSLEQMKAALGQEVPPGEIRLLLDDMVEILENHNIEEESFFYPKADEVHKGPAAQAFLQGLRKTKLPEGWKCISLR